MLIQRPRRLRHNEAITAMIREHRIHPNDFIVPLFVMEGHNTTEAIPSMPGYIDARSIGSPPNLIH